MTLNTEVYVHGPADPQEVFHFCRSSARPTEHPFSDEAAGVMGAREGERTLGNQCGIGLPAWLMLHYRVDGPLTTAAEAAAHDVEICDEDCDGRWHPPACHLRLWFDTAYAYRDELGRGCGALHASYVAQLGQWLDERGISWSWKNEFTGERFGGEDRYERLMELHGGGEDAMRWFDHVVRPAIPALVEDETP